VTVAGPGAPFLPELAAILLRQLSRIDPRPDKGPAAEVGDERLVGHRHLEPCIPRPERQVTVIEEPESEALIEPADRLLHGPLHEQAESREPPGSEPLPPVFVAPPHVEHLHLVEVAVGDVVHKLLRRRIVRLAHPRQVRRRAVDRSVVDDDKLPLRPRALDQRPHTVPRKLELVPAGDDDRRQVLSWMNRYIGLRS